MIDVNDLNEQTGGPALFERPEGDDADDYVEVTPGMWYHKAALHVESEPSTRMEHYEALVEEGGADHPECKGIGDVTSSEKGSGARYNAGKPPLHYIPLRQQIIVWRGFTRWKQMRKAIIEELARFEKREVPMWNVVSLLHLSDLVEASYVWEYGAKKYAAYNWAKGMPWSVPLGCIERHISAMLLGKETDTESGCTHWGHVVCNILMLEHFERYYRDGDDRPPKEIW